MIILMPSKLFPLLTTSCFLQTHPGSMDISWGIVATTSPLAVHIACDVGNRVHTRNDSDEDVRGNACNQAIAWRALPWSFIIQTFSLL